MRRGAEELSDLREEVWKELGSEARARYEYLGYERLSHGRIAPGLETWRFFFRRDSQGQAVAETA